MRIVIEGHDLPGAEFVSEGVPLHNVHVAVQIGKHPVGLVRGDTDSARWEIDVRPVADGGVVDLRGPAVFGKKGERFLYLTWGDVGAGGSFARFRRAKLMIGDIEPELLAAATRVDGVLVASLSLTDERGGPRCARVKPPVISWRPAERLRFPGGLAGTCTAHADGYPNIAGITPRPRARKRRFVDAVRGAYRVDLAIVA